MKTLIGKELRENLALTVLGLLIFSLLLAVGYRNYEDVMKSLALGGTSARGSMQPLAEGDFHLFTAFFCGLFAALLGWFQVYHERHRDLWSYLVHRPATRTQIFAAKVTAGMGLYAVAAGLPLLVFILWTVIPGNIAAPFEWPMLWPALIFFLAGVVAYFAGMLTGLRQARWYASRGLPLGLGFGLFVSAASMPRAGQALVLIVFGVIVVAASTWAAFQTNGAYRGQPWAGRLGLPVALVFGSMPVILVGAALMQIVLPGWRMNDYSWAHYEMGKDGAVYKLTTSALRPATILDLEGHPMLDPKTGRLVGMQEFGVFIARNAYLNTAGWQRPPYMDVGHSIALERVTPNTLWYYWPRYGRLVAFDALTRRPSGSLGPNGFSPDLSGGGQRFDYPAGQVARGFPILHTASVAYFIEIESRSVRPVFTAEKDDEILDSSEVMFAEQGQPQVAVLTRHSVRLLTTEGTPVWQAAYQPGYQGNAQVRVWALNPPGNVALWVTPARSPDQSTTAGEPTTVRWFADDRSTKSVELPDPQAGQHRFGFQEKVIGFTMPPIVFGLAPVIMGEPWPAGYKPAWQMGSLALALAALVCVPIGWWRCRRYSFTLASRLGWSLFLLLTGLPGLLAFLSVHEWPAREPCPQCHRLRVVEREQCEHCGAQFSKPEKIGIEIFEDAGSLS